MDNPLNLLKGKNNDPNTLYTQPKDDTNRSLEFPTDAKSDKVVEPKQDKQEEVLKDELGVVEESGEPASGMQEVKDTEYTPEEDTPPRRKVPPPSKGEIQDSYDALQKLKYGSVPFSRQTRFVANPAGNLGVMVMRREDGAQIVESYKPYTFIRDQQNNIAWTVFKKPKRRFGKLVITSEKVERVFNSELAMPSMNGYLSCHDAGSFVQIPFTQNRDLVSLFHKLDKQINETSQGIIIANSEAARKKAKGTWLEKYATSIMLVFCMIILGIALIELGADISGFSTAINNLASTLNQLQSGVIGKAVGGVGGTPAIMAWVTQMFL